MQYLGKIADSKSLTGTRKKQWLTTQKKLLQRGEIGAVVDEITTLLGSETRQMLEIAFSAMEPPRTRKRSLE